MSAMSEPSNRLFAIGFAFLSITAGCSAEPDVHTATAYTNEELGIHFDYPDGWRQLRPDELPVGKESLVTIEDSSGVAQVSLVEFELQPILGALDTRLMMEAAGGDNAQRALALFVQLNSSFESSFERRYERFQLLEREWVRALAGQRAVASELVFKGQLPGEPLMWRKVAIILKTGQDEKGFIMAYAVPSLLLDEHREAFQFVEDSWRTID
jgi:hypothetical protein